MKKLFIILFVCLFVLPSRAASFGHLTVFISDFPQINPTDSFNLFASDIAGSSAGTAGPLILTEGGQVYYFAGGSAPRMEIGGRNPLTTFTVRGTPVLNFGLGYFNDQHAWTGSSGTGPELYGAVGLQSVWKIGMLDSILSDNSYNVDVGALNGVINTFQHKNLRLSAVKSDGTVIYPLIINHTGFVSLTDGVTGGGTGILQFTDSDGLLQGDTNAMGQGGSITLTPSPTKGLYLQGGLRYNYITASGTFDIATNNYFIEVTVDSSVLTLPDASDVGAGKAVIVRANSGVTATVEGRGADTINGAADDTVSPLEAVMYVSGGIDDWKKIAVFDPSAGGSGYDTIEEEGAPLAQESVINFIGSTLTAAAGSGETTVTSDSDVDALASNSSNGLWARTGSGTGAARTITAGTGISVSNGDGVSGNPTITYTGSAIFQIPTISKTLTDGSPTDVFEVDLAAGERCNFIVRIGIEVSDGTDFQSYTAVCNVAAINKAGTISIDERLGTDNIAFATSDVMNNLIVTYPDSGDTDSFIFQVDADTDIAGATITMRYTVESLTTTTITPL